MDTNTETFNRDAANLGGYVYTTNTQLSSNMANRRLTETALATTDFRGKNVLDIGCGDGTYSIELFDLGQPTSIHGVDPAAEAIEVAQQKTGDPKITFSVDSAYELPYEANSFDVAHLRGVLHHLDSPVDALREALRVAPTLVVIEPNGNSPVLKLIERTSRYHIEHKEKSYSSQCLNRWVHSLGGAVTVWQWAGLVPMFCPDWMARTLKVIEPVVERVPLINAVGCAVYVFAAVRRNTKRL